MTDPRYADPLRPVDTDDYPAPRRRPRSVLVLGLLALIVGLAWWVGR